MPNNEHRRLLHGLGQSIRAALAVQLIDAAEVENLRAIVMSRHDIDLLDGSGDESSGRSGFAVRSAVLAAESLAIDAPRQMRKAVATSDDQAIIIGYASKRYDHPNERYWFGVNSPQLERARQFRHAWLAFGCGSEHRTVLVPLAQFELWAEDLNTRAHPGGGTHWHVQFERRGPELVLRLQGRGHDVPVDDFIIPSASDD